MIRAALLSRRSLDRAQVDVFEEYVERAVRGGDAQLEPPERRERVRRAQGGYGGTVEPNLDRARATGLELKRNSCHTPFAGVTALVSVPCRRRAPRAGPTTSGTR